jgi:23S rRNA (cytosine1962-C5)-methyltransferase
MNWKDYSLIDCGGQEKLERFGTYILRRPEPQAIWSKQLEAKIWDSYDALFTRSNQDKPGGWLYKRKPIEPWWISYNDLKIKLQCTSFGHIGLFPEQKENWERIHTALIKLTNPKLLNLFAYTGVASIVSRKANAEVYHVDAVSSMITWAKSNMEASKLADIRWVTEDVLKFVSREVNRNKEYDVILLDPPAYGRGPKGEKWQLEDQLDDLIKKCAELLQMKGKLLLLNMYSMGYSTSIAKQLLELHFNGWHTEAKELIITTESGLKLPLGITGMAYQS